MNEQGQSAVASASATPAPWIKFTIDEPIQPVRPAVGLDPGKVELGRRIFSDARLSRDGSQSCATCHDLTQGGTNHNTYAMGAGGFVDAVNTLSVFNSARNFRLFWDGRADSLEQAMDISVTSPQMLAASWSDVVDKLKADPGYVAAFNDIYSGGITRQSITDALAAFDRSLVTPGSRFDQFLMGNKKAITAEEKHGYELFKSYGCISCHQGMNVGGNMFETFGVMADYFGDRGNVTNADLGRFNLTGDEDDRHKFRVPSLRNVALTSPYFHDGTETTLEGAINDMAKYQLGRQLSHEEVEDIVKFLKTLTGKYNGRALWSQAG
jgi:cytochrome c peroxidase